MDNYDRTAMEVKIKQLEKENKYLKSLLDKAGISYFQLSESTLKTDEGISSEIVLNQHFKITDDLANRFFAMFWGLSLIHICCRAKVFQCFWICISIIVRIPIPSCLNGCGADFRSKKSKKT